jgi:hypothetical protein
MDSPRPDNSGSANDPSLQGNEDKMRPVQRRPRAGVALRTFYGDHMLSCNSMLQDDGRYQARVAITTLGGCKTCAQRFLDLEVYESHEAAVERALQAGKAWVNANG